MPRRSERAVTARWAAACPQLRRLRGNEQIPGGDSSKLFQEEIQNLNESIKSKEIALVIKKKYYLQRKITDPDGLIGEHR